MVQSWTMTLAGAVTRRQTQHLVLLARRADLHRAIPRHTGIKTRAYKLTPHSSKSIDFAPPDVRPGSLRVYTCTLGRSHALRGSTLEEKTPLVAVHVIGRKRIPPSPHQLPTSYGVTAVQPLAAPIGTVLLGHDQHAVPTANPAANHESTPCRVALPAPKPSKPHPQDGHKKAYKVSDSVP